MNCRLCQAPIKFSKQHISQRSGKMIPLDPLTEAPHDCPVWKRERAFNPNNNQSRPHQSGWKYYQCRRGCGSMIYFDDTQKTEGGKWIPIDKETEEPHDCGR
jgi:hypothetical protein